MLLLFKDSDSDLVHSNVIQTRIAACYMVVNKHIHIFEVCTTGQIISISRKSQTFEHLHLLTDTGDGESDFDVLDLSEC